MTEYLEYYEDVKMGLQPGEYTAKVKKIKRPSGTETYTAPDVSMIWEIVDGEFAGLDVKQNFRLTHGDEDQKTKSKRKLNKTLEALFGKKIRKIPEQNIIGKTAIISVAEFNSYTFVSEVKEADVTHVPVKNNQIDDLDSGILDLNNEIPY